VKLALELTATKDKRHIGLYYLSLIADAQGEFDKSLWLLNKAEAANKNLSLINYEKAKVLYSVEGINSSLNYFGKVVDMKDVSPEVRVILAIKSFSDRDYKAAIEDFSRLSSKANYTYGLDLLNVKSILKIEDFADKMAIENETIIKYKIDTLEKKILMQKFINFLAVEFFSGLFF